MTQLAVRDVASQRFVGVSESDDLAGAVDVLRSEGANAALVLRGESVVGLLTASDVLDHVGALDGVTVADAMGAPPTAVRPDAAVSEAAEVVRQTGVGYVVVRDDEGVRGLVEARDLVDAGAEPREPLNPTQSARAEATDGGQDGAFSTQSICEVCGSLAGSLSNVNGQLVCADCHAV
ncbi:CBS domain-containing protein [Halocalculus aciditolerans]|uniref:Inosine-5-monophosphate dehydrogenase n=1 Tax=Halocalculus aciditolerans TaxID=1383812 RepID=A0A830F9W1_9EURY|nr:CBS domain-containing protein [Halocalculus aciditolerans]GGL53979.1 inosine-5-monophosphate dehydrogenase [Halocalculus aciditolerans]